MDKQKELLQELYKQVPNLDNLTSSVPETEFPYPDNPVDKMILENRMLREEVHKLRSMKDRLLKQIGILTMTSSESESDNKDPVSKQDITACFMPGMKQKQKAKAIMNAYGVSYSTARKWMRDNHLTDQRYTRNDYK